MNVIAIKLSFYIITIAVMAYFASAETSLTSLSTISLKALKQKHPRLARHIAFWEERPSEILSTIIVGMTLAIIANGVIATSLALDIASVTALPRYAVLAAVPVLSVFVTLILGELSPKIISRYNAERVAVAVLPSLVTFDRRFSVPTRFFLDISEKVVGMFGKQHAKEAPFLKPEELKILLLSDDTLPLPSPARRIMENIIDFGTTRIQQVMVPRTEMQAVNLEQGLDAVIDQIIEKGYSRVPVYRGNLDNIVGIIYSKDLALAWRGGSLFVIDDLVRPAYFVPGSARTDQVLREFRTGHQHMALVVDEFGSTIGLVTIEDLVEEIVGEIWDEYDIREKRIIPFPDGSYLVRASESLDAVNDELKLSLPSNEFTTVSGWVLDLFGRIPKVGDIIRWDDLEIEVTDADKKKIQRVKIKKRN